MDLSEERQLSNREMFYRSGFDIRGQSEISFLRQSNIRRHGVEVKVVRAMHQGSPCSDNMLSTIDSEALVKFSGCLLRMAAIVNT